MSSAASSKPTQRPWTVATVGLLFFCIHARWFVRCADQRLEGVLGFGAVLIVLGIWLAARPGIEQMTADAQPRGLGVTPPSPEMTKKRRGHLAVTHPGRWLRDQCIFKVNAAPVGRPWMWTLAFEQHEERQPTHGYAATREAAMAAFAKSWRRK
jgi:hypothetical protein